MKKIIIFTFILISFFSCEEDCNSVYIFQIPVSVPVTDPDIKVNDTLTISIVIDTDEIIDTLENRIVSIPKFDPRAAFLFPMLDTFPVIDGLTENTLLVNEEYETDHIPFSTLSSGLLFHEIVHYDHYSKIEFKIVFKKPGTYALYSLNELQGYDKYNRIYFEGRCGRGNLYAIYTYNNSDDYNSDLLTEQNKEVEEQYWEFRNGARLDSAPFYFRVKE